MVNANADALGIIFPNSYDEQVPDLVNERLMASIPFASRYRMVDFILSSMVNCGIGNVSIIVRKNYHSLMDHLGSGREWDLARKKGGLNIVPPYSEKKIQVYSGRVEALANVLDFLKWQKEKYVVMADTNIACNFDFKEMLNQHIESGADVTAAYTKQPIPEGVRSSYEKTNYLHYTFSMAGQKISKIFVNSEENGVQNVSMNIYVMERQLLIDEIKKGFVLGNKFFERDVLAPQTEKLNIQGYEFTGYQARIDDMKLDDSGNVRIILSEGTIEAIEYRKIGKKREGERRTPKSTDLRTQDYILERETRMKVGEIFQRDKMEQTIRNIYRTGLFTSIQPNFKPSATDPNGRIIEMEAEERPAASINGNISYGTSVGFLGGINYTDSNFLGRAQEFKAAIEISDEGDQTYEISIFDPWIRGTERLQAGASIYYRQTEDDDANGTDLYKVKRYGTRWTLGQGLNDDIYVRGAIRYEDVKEYYRSGAKRDDYDLVAFTPTITYDTRNNRFSPQKGLYLSLSDEIGKIVSDHRSYNQFEIDLRAYHRTFFKDKNTMAYRAVWGTTGSETPEALRFKMGGADSIRGYDYGDFEGYNEFYFNVENRTQVTNSIQVVAFFDIGNAWQTNDKKPDRDGADKFKDLKSGAGIGVRILTPVGPLKFDYAWPLDIAPGETKKDNGKFYFNFGPSW